MHKQCAGTADDSLRLVVVRLRPLAVSCCQRMATRACLHHMCESRAQVLTALQGLRSLAVNRCPRIGDKGLLIVQRLSHLTSLNCYGCVKARPIESAEIDVYIAAQGMPLRYR